MVVADKLIKQERSNQTFLTEEFYYGRQLHQFPKRIDKDKVVETLNKAVARQRQETLTSSEYQNMVEDCKAKG